MSPWLSEISDAGAGGARVGMLKALVSHIKPQKRIAITDSAKTDPAALKSDDDLEILLSEDEAKELLASVGFRPAEAIDGYTLAGIEQWYINFDCK